MEGTQSDIGKYEINQQVTLNLKPCNDGEESKIANAGEASTKRVSPASVGSGTNLKNGEKSSNTY